jgi:2,4-didehydro-3-deoxy-L-rhamnonate hydrolase
MPFRLANIAGRAALVDGAHYYDLDRISGGDMGADVMDALARCAELSRWQAAISADIDPDGELAATDIRAAVPRPKNCFAVGLNYRSHAAESGMDVPANPLVFTKFPSCLVGANDDVVLNSTAADYEAELVVVIGIGGRNIAVEQAWTHVAGLTMGQDISDRALQFAAKPPHFDLGKSRDTYGPIGPVIVSVDSFASPDDIAIVCRVNDDVRQSDTTASLIFNVPTLISYLSNILTLSPGDVIFTGTPDGVGAPKGMFLRSGDVIVTEIAGIDSMTNHCVA